MKTYAEAMKDASREYLAQVLAEAHGNVTNAAMLAGMDRAHMHKLLKTSGVREPDAVHSAKVKKGQQESRAQ